MKLSTKGRYGLRAMIDLASHEEEGALPAFQNARISQRAIWSSWCVRFEKPDSLRVCGEQAVDMYLQNRQIPFR